MTWDITDNDYDKIHIKFNNGVAITYVPKFRIYMTVTEPYLYLYWTDTELGSAGITRMLQIDYNDVSSLPASATVLKATIEAMIAGSVGGTVQSVTGLDTDNTDPANPIVQIAVDGITVTGQGTPADPLVGHSAGGANLWGYKAKTTITTGDPLPSHIIWDNATQISATQLNLSHITDDGFDIDLYFPYLVTGDILIVQDRDDSTNYQTWVVSSTPTIIPNSYIEIPVTFNSSGGAGTTNFANNHQLLIAKFNGASGSGITISAGTSSANLGSVVFSNSNGVSFGLNGSTITASHNGITSQTVQPAVGLNTAGTNITWTVNSSGISIDAGAYLTTARASNDAVGLNTAQTNVTWTVNSSGISINAGAYLTTARASNDAVGLNTAATNVTWTVNSSGISLNAGGYAGTGTSATNASVTLNSNGLAISVAAPGGGVTPAISGSNGSFSFSTVTFGNLNGLSFYTSNGSMVGSYTVPAGGSPNFSAGTTSNNLNSVVFSNANGVSFGLNGSTITGSVNAAGGGIAVSRWPIMPTPLVLYTTPTGTVGSTGGSSQVTASGFIMFQPLHHDIHFADLMMEHNASATIAGTGSATIGHMLGIYTLDANTRLSLISSFQHVMRISQSSVTARSHHWNWGTASSANSSSLGGNVSASFSGLRWLLLNETNATLAAGNYYIGYMQTMSTVGSLVYHHSQVQWNSAASWNQATRIGTGLGPDFGKGFNGVFSTTTNHSSNGLPMMPATINTSALTGSANSSQLRYPYFIMNRYNT